MKKFTPLFFTILLASANLFAGTYSGGTGTSGDPYQIATTDDLIELSNTNTDWDAHFIQTAHISFNSDEQQVDWDGDGTADWDANDQLGFSPIGNNTTNFTGSYDGDGHTISNLFIDRSTTDFIGLFGYTYEATISNLGLLNVNIIGEDKVGGIVGYSNNYSYINTCYSTGSVTSSSIVGGIVGGIAGQINDNCEINSSYSTCSVSSTQSGYVGGIAGQIKNNSEISSSYSTGNVSGNNRLGGLVGYCSFSSISGCYSTGNVNSSNGDFVGGFVGYDESSDILKNYSTGNVTGGISDVGGFIGYCSSGGTLDANYWKTDGGSLEDTGNDGDIANITESSDGDMKDQSHFTSWDFGIDNTDWVMSSPISFAGYPTLRWTGGYADEITVTPKEIASLPNLVWVAENSGRWATDYTQTADINMWTVPSWYGNQGWTPIGNLTTQFTGSYNGDGYTISNLYINRPTTDNVGLFGFIEGNTSTEVQNLGILNVNITGEDNVGGLAGTIQYNSTISNCYSTGNINANGTPPFGGNGGGLVAYLHSSSNIINSYSTASVSGSVYVGGLAGRVVSNCTISNSYSTGNISGNLALGGLVGWNDNNSTISNSYSTGNVSGNNWLGGLVGYTYFNSNIENSYSLGDVTRLTGTNTLIGGFCGYANDNSYISNSYSIGSVIYSNATNPEDKAFLGGEKDNSGVHTNNFFDSEVSNQSSDAVGAATAKTTSEMKTQSTFTNWDFTADPDKDWNIQSGSYISYPYIQDITYDELEATLEVNPIPGLELKIIFVKHGATGNNDGTSWTDAYTSLQTALNNATSGKEIWVAAGTYNPVQDYDLGDESNPRLYHFRMVEGVEIYGGFAGTETLLSGRDIENNETILSGDLSDNDDFDVTNGGYQGTTGDDNCYHVFYHPSGLGLTSDAVLDGFTITGGNANENDPHFAGGGMYNTSCSPTLTNLTISNNSADYGGGLYNEANSSPELTNVTISNNTADYGGGMYNINYSLPELTNVTISNNTAISYGGGMHNYYYASPELTNVTISNNTAYFGGGMYNDLNSSPELTNVTISNNTAISYGGGMYNDLNSSPELTNVTISNNSANLAGGMLNMNSTATLTNVTISNNDASSYGGGMVNANNSTATINNSIIWDNDATLTGNEFYIESGTTTLNYSCYSNGTDDIDDNSGNGTFTATNNNITENPKFADASSDDFRIALNSPCLDTGNDTYNTETYDIRGEDRIQGVTIDMGAYEWTSGDPIGIVISTNNIQIIGDSKAKSGGTITDDGASAITQKGVCWNTTGTPTLADNYTNDGSGDADFTSIMSGLSVNQQYYIRAYATNSDGTVYGDEKTFIYTAIPTLPEWGLIILGSLVAFFAVRKLLA
jgi:hypothetical protein